MTKFNSKKKTHTEGDFSHPVNSLNAMKLTSSTKATTKNNREKEVSNNSTSKSKMSRAVKCDNCSRANDFDKEHRTC